MHLENCLHQYAGAKHYTDSEKESEYERTEYTHRALR